MIDRILATNEPNTAMLNWISSADLDDADMARLAQHSSRHVADAVLAGHYDELDVGVRDRLEHKGFLGGEVLAGRGKTTMGADRQEEVFTVSEKEQQEISAAIGAELAVDPNLTRITVSPELAEAAKRIRENKKDPRTR